MHNIPTPRTTPRLIAPYLGRGLKKKGGGLLFVVILAFAGRKKRTPQSATPGGRAPRPGRFFLAGCSIDKSN